MIYIIAFFACAIWFATFISPYLVALLILISFYHILRATVRATHTSHPRILPARPQDIGTQSGRSQCVRPPRGQRPKLVK